jgi:hemolysin III
MMRIREPFNTYSHAFGIVLGVAVTISLGILSGGQLHLLVAALVFGLSMVLLYTASTVYHAVYGTDTTLTILRKLDHAAIFMFIAGSYTPMLLGALPGAIQPYALAVIWALALAGVGLKVFTLATPRWLSTASYVGLGWLAVMLLPAMKLSPWMLAWLMAGGVVYSLGVVYGLKRPNLWPNVVGFHGLWHVFVLGGSVCMFLAVLGLYIPALH